MPYKNKSKRREYSKNHYSKNKERYLYASKMRRELLGDKLRDQKLTAYRENIEENRKKSREYYARTKEKRLPKIREYRKKTREKRLVDRKKWRVKRKETVFNHYGEKCICCYEPNKIFLTIDHTKNDGAEHRRSLGNHSGSEIYTWLIRNNFPSGFQTMCYNCNNGKRLNNGICPHNELKNER